MIDPVVQVTAAVWLLAALVVLLALLGPRRPRCARCGCKLNRRPRLHELDAHGAVWPLCGSCFLGTFR